MYLRVIANVPYLVPSHQWCAPVKTPNVDVITVENQGRNSKGDYWLVYPDRVVRVHVRQRKAFFSPESCNCSVDSTTLFDQRVTRYYCEGEWTTFMRKDGSLNDAAPAPEVVDSGGASSSDTARDVLASDQDPGGLLAAEGDGPVVGGPSAAEGVTDDHEAMTHSKEMSLRLDAQSITHMLTHKRKNIFCVICDRAKTKQVPHMRGAFSRPLTKWGDVITADHGFVHHDTRTR